MALEVRQRAILEVPIGLTDDELPEWWASHASQIATMNSVLWKLTRQMRSILREQGAVPTKNGTLTLATDKYEWDEATLLAEFPQMGAHAVKAEKLTHEEAERAFEILLELGIDVDKITHSMEPNLNLVNKAMKVMEPEKVMRLLSLRKPNGKVEVS